MDSSRNERPIRWNKYLSNLSKLFGFPTFWVNPQKLPAEKLDATADGSGDTLAQLVQFLE